MGLRLSAGPMVEYSIFSSSYLRSFRRKANVNPYALSGTIMLRDQRRPMGPEGKTLVSAVAPEHCMDFANLLVLEDGCTHFCFKVQRVSHDPH